MKVAEVVYGGPMTPHVYRTPRGERYRFVPGRPEPLESLEDAEWFKQQDGFDVEWTVHGDVLRTAGGSIDDLQAYLQDVGYREKQKLAQLVGIKANQSDEELTAELEDAVDDLQATIEAHGE